MTPIFADSFYFFALVNPRDAAHRKAVDFSDKYDGPLAIITLNRPDSMLYSNESTSRRIHGGKTREKQTEMFDEEKAE